MRLWLESKLTAYGSGGMYIKFRITIPEEECWLKQIRSLIFYFSWLIPLENSFMVVLFDDKFVRVFACRNVVDKRDMDRNKIQAEQKVHRGPLWQLNPLIDWCSIHSLQLEDLYLDTLFFTVILLHKLLKIRKKSDWLPSM